MTRRKKTTEVNNIIQEKSCCLKGLAGFFFAVKMLDFHFLISYDENNK